ncbi:MAG TPA: molybdenum cofactor biosynthesis protein MoaE [Solirubrobacterales bacterium]|nr:molybdenum cofactor biosynthesis protein MoaE [Solirubrobacterales bacterium]
MRLSVRLFAVLRERAGADEVDIDLGEGATAADALQALRMDPRLCGVMERMPARLAVNREYAFPDTPLAPGDELAAIPPISGGAGLALGAVRARVREESLDAGELSIWVGRPGAGAIVSFQGTTRDVDLLEYEAYAAMAEERIARILEECVERHGLEAAAAEHRVGSVPLGEAGVVVAVSAAHREEAFAGAREAIDRIKAEAPIWKREVEAGESRWVEGTLP